MLLHRSAPHFDPGIQHSLITVRVAYIIVDQGPETMFSQTVVKKMHTSGFGLEEPLLSLFSEVPGQRQVRKHIIDIFEPFLLTFFFHKRVRIRDICLKTDLFDGSAPSQCSHICFKVCAAVIE